MTDDSQGPDHVQQPAEPSAHLLEPRLRRARVRVERWPRGLLGWMKAAAFVASVMAVAVAAVGFVHYVERASCRDAIEGRHDLRASIHETVETVAREARTDGPDLARILTRVDTNLVDRYGHPRCAQRWNIDPWRVLQGRDAMDPADPLVRQHLAEQGDRRG